MAAGGSSSGFSSTGISPRPMLMGAPHNALRAFNAGVSLTLSVRHRPQAATPALRSGAVRSIVWGPRKVARLCGERRSSVMIKLSRLRGSERYVACSDDVMAHRPPGSAQTGMYPSALYCAGIPCFLCQGAITYARSVIAAGKGKPAAAVYAGKTLKPVMML